MMLQKISNSILNIAPEDVIEQAQDQGLDVQSIEDFRKQRYHYSRIEKVMDEYRDSFTRYSALGGLTTGIGGFTTSVTFAGLDTISLAIQLYRLSQRFAILNGFDGDDPLQKDKMLNIYFEALGINAVTQATLKHQLLRASAKAEAGEAAENIILKLVIRVARIFGRQMSSEEAGRLVPIIGGFIGAGVSYSFAKKASDSMKKAFKRAYFKSWQGEEVD